MTDEDRLNALLDSVGEYKIEILTADRQKITTELFAVDSDQAYRIFDEMFLTLHADKCLDAMGYKLGDLRLVRAMRMRSPEGNLMTVYRTYMREMDYRFRRKKG